MPLSRQLIIVIFLLFLLVFSGAFAINAHNTREFLYAQLESHAQDTATSLGLSLTEPYTEGDLSIVNSMVDAIFDRGYYQEILIHKISGEIDIERRQDIVIEKVPSWFIDILPIKVPVGESLISSGWKQAATISVRSHPGYAYVELWDSVVGTFWWSFVSFIFALLAVFGVIRLVLKPLSEMESQALAIADREFPILEKLPYTRELRRAVIAMNIMSRKIKSIFDEQSVLTENLRRETYIDSVTGLMNKKSYRMRVANIVGNEKDIIGVIYIVQLKDLSEYNDRHGYSAGDELIKNVADILIEACNKYARAILARVSGSDFSIFIPGLTSEEASELAMGICAKVASVPLAMELQNIVHVGGAYFKQQVDINELMSQADMALRSAQIQGSTAWSIYDSSVTGESEVHSANEWKDIIETYLVEERFYLLFQPVVSCIDNQLLHYEVLLRVGNTAGFEIHAGVFMPMAERFSHLGYTTRIDKYVIEKVIEKINNEQNESIKYAINLSPYSIKNDEFIKWFENQISKNPSVLGRLIFETAEYSVMSNLDGLKALNRKLKKYDIAFSLDHFGTGHVPFGYLHGLKLNYIKIDGSYIQSLITDKDAQFYVQSIAQIAHSLDIVVIAEFVENNEIMQKLRDLYVDGAQGYYIGPPAHH